VKWKAAYLENRILSADPVELICILYEHAILAVQEARDGIEKRDIAARSKAISKAIAIIGELESSLNHGAGGEVAGNLARLYQYIRERLLLANRCQEAGPLVEVERLLKTVGEAWDAIRPEAVPVSAPEQSREIPGGAWGLLQAEPLDTHTAHSWSA
jgi:flagellar secretion chaperone FliS